MQVLNNCIYSLLSLVEKNLRIKSLEAGDAGTYTCYVSTNGPEVSVSHNLHILGNYTYIIYYIYLFVAFKEQVLKHKYTFYVTFIYKVLIHRYTFYVTFIF